MKLVKSPGAVAAHGASEIDQLRGKVGQENSSSGLNAQPRFARAKLGTWHCSSGNSPKA